MSTNRCDYYLCSRPPTTYCPMPFTMLTVCKAHRQILCELGLFTISIKFIGKHGCVNRVSLTEKSNIEESSGREDRENVEIPEGLLRFLGFGWGAQSNLEHFGEEFVTNAVCTRNKEACEDPVVTLVVDRLLQMYTQWDNYKQCKALFTQLSSVSCTASITHKVAFKFVEICSDAKVQKFSSAIQMLKSFRNSLKLHSPSSNLIPIVCAKLGEMSVCKVVQSQQETLQKNKMLRESDHSQKVSKRPFAEFVIAVENWGLFEKLDREMMIVKEEMVSALAKSGKFDLESVASALLMIGIYFKKRRNYGDAKLCFKSAYANCKNARKNFELCLKIVRKLGKIYHNTKQSNKEMRLFSDFLSFDTVPQCQETQLLYTDLGDLYAKAENYTKADDCFNSSISLGEKIKSDPCYTIDAYLRQTFMHCSASNTERGKEIYAIARSMLQQIRPSAVNSSEFLQEMREKYDMIGDWVQLWERIELILSAYSTDKDAIKLESSLQYAVDHCRNRTVTTDVLTKIVEKQTDFDCGFHAKAIIASILASEQMDFKNLDEAEKWLTVALTVHLERKSHPSIIIKTVQKLSTISKKATTYIDLALKYCQEVDSNSIEIATLQIAAADKMQENSAFQGYEVSALYQSAFNIMRNYPNSHPSIHVLFDQLATLYEALGEYQKMETLYSDYFILFADHSEKVSEKWRELASFYYDHGMFDKSENCYRAALEIYQNIAPNSLDFLQLLTEAGNSCLKNNKFNDSKLYFDQAVALLASTDHTMLTHFIDFVWYDWQKQPICLTHKSWFLLSLFDFFKAIKRKDVLEKLHKCITEEGKTAAQTNQKSSQAKSDECDKIKPFEWKYSLHQFQLFKSKPPTFEDEMLSIIEQSTLQSQLWLTDLQGKIPPLNKMALFHKVGLMYFSKEMIREAQIFFAGVYEAILETGFGLDTDPFIKEALVDYWSSSRQSYKAALYAATQLARESIVEVFLVEHFYARNVPGKAKEYAYRAMRQSILEGKFNEIDDILCVRTQTFDFHTRKCIFQMNLQLHIDLCPFPSMLALAYWKLALFYDKFYRVGSIPAFKSAISLLTTINPYSKFTIEAESHLAKLYHNSSQYDLEELSLKNVLRAVLQTDPFSTFAASLYKKLGKRHLQQANTTEAEEMLKNSYEVYHRIARNSTEAAKALDLLGSCYLAAGKFPLAKGLFCEGLVSRPRKNRVVWGLSCKVKLVEALWGMKQVAKAEVCMIGSRRPLFDGQELRRVYQREY